MTGNRSITEDEEATIPQHQRLVRTGSGQSAVSSEGNTSVATNDVTLVVTPSSNLSSTMGSLSPSKRLSAAGDSSSVQVAVRVRPLLSSLESGCGSCVQILPSGDPRQNYSTAIQVGPESGPTFTFDEVFPTTTTQVHVYQHRVAPLVERSLEGFNATILAYGQTGSGKTHTVIGPSTCHSSPEDASSGMIPRAVSSLFEKLQLKKMEFLRQQSSSQSSLDVDALEQATPDVKATKASKSPPATPSKENDDKDDISFEFQVRVQFLELYGEEIRDLLATSSSSSSAGERLTIRDIGNDEPEVVGATSQVVESAEEALRCLTKGMLRRVTAATAMNESSSRSHAIFSILMEQTWTTTSSTTAAKADETGATTAPQVRKSKFNFVDLAGSERQKRTRAEGRRLKEGIDINKGLLVLGNVISALGDPKKRGKAFVPYRDSKLTRLLKGSLGGNHKTLMIACVSPSSTNMEESLNCLRYANRAKNIQNRAIVNVDARSRMIAELKTQVQALAQDLLRAKDTGDISGCAFTRQALVALANGASAAGKSTFVGTSSPTKHATSTITPFKATSVKTPLSGTSTPEATLRNTVDSQQQQQQRLMDTEEELERSRNQLKKCRRDSLVMEERLHVTIAEKEFFKLQLETVGKDENCASNVSPKLEIDRAFVARAAEYEKEIDRLKDELRVVRSQIVEEREPVDFDLGIEFSIEKANETMRAERERLSVIQNELLPPSSSSNGNNSPPQSPFRRVPDEEMVNENDMSGIVDSETKEEEDHLTALTLKYSHVDDEDEMMLVDKQDSQRVSDSPDQARADSDEKTSEHRRAQIEADLLEISRIIESKEELISQLQCSQAKYSSMKEFYEGKLHQMEQLLDQKEEERQKIIIQLERLKENNHDTKELEEQLKKKEEHIAGIRKQKLQLKDLTAVSSKNAAEIRKLQNDVRSMKERKVSMQKQLTEERKAHASEIRMLKKEVIQKDRETRKWQKISTQKTSEAERANQVAKMKVQQLGQLRAKYKDAEKTIRMLQIKKGVMAKAGLDSVIVGRRAVETSRNQSRDPANEDRSVDADSIRDYFDRQVAEVGRKEALADKLARGWEEHLQLTLQRSELEEQGAETSKEDIQALDLRIQYEEDRIRKLAHRLGKKQPTSSSNEVDTTEHQSSFLYGKDFKELCNGASPAKSSEIAAKVLFGMVVRERRRIASLAKTASALDEKLQECQMDCEAKEVAFRSYVQDSQQDFANISMSHQEQILSLMSLVKGEEGDDGNEERADSGDSATLASEAVDSEVSGTETSKLLILANERVAVLEQQLRELNTEKKVSESYRLEKEEVKAALDAKSSEYEKLEIRLASLRTTLRQVRDQLADAKDGKDASSSDLVDACSSCVAAIRDALLESPGPLSPTARRHSCPMVFKPTTSSPGAQKEWEYIQAANDEDEGADEETPDWADEIMADLALIAEGQLPPSLQGIPEMMHEPGVTTSSVRATGIPKPSISAPNSPSQRAVKTSPGLSDGDSGNSEDSLSPEVVASSAARKGSPGEGRLVHSNRAEGSSLVPREIHASLSLKSEASAASKTSREDSSVYDRLATKLTGTQKEKHQAHTESHKEHLDSVADRMLDHLLESNADLFGRRASDASVKAVGIEAGSKVKEYTQQNVFERLQKTTTQSFAVKHAPTHDFNDILNESHSSQLGTAAHKQQHDTVKGPRSSTDGRTKRSVAPTTSDHHQITSPESSSTPSKHKSPSRLKYKSRIKPPEARSSSPARGKSPAKTRKEEYTQQNVFERLTKTTTEAYAVKKRVVKN